MRCRSRFAAAIAMSLTLVAVAHDVNATESRKQRVGARSENFVRQEALAREKVNNWTIGVAGGLLEGAPIRFAVEVARAVDAGDDLHVLPIVTRGPAENVESLLYLRGVDLAILNTDSLEQFKPLVPNIRQRISYVVNLFPSELHIFVRPEINSVEDLAGKKVNFNTPGTAAAYSGPLIFERLGVAVEKVFVPHQSAVEAMKKGDIAAVVFVKSKPVDAFAKARWEAGYKFLPVPYDKRFEDYYLPSTLTSADYPQLIPAGEKVSTIAVSTFLAAYSWPKDAARYPRAPKSQSRVPGPSPAGSLLLSRRREDADPVHLEEGRELGLRIRGAGVCTSNREVDQEEHALMHVGRCRRGEDAAAVEVPGDFVGHPFHAVDVEVGRHVWDRDLPLRLLVLPRLVGVKGHVERLQLVSIGLHDVDLGWPTLGGGEQPKGRPQPTPSGHAGPHLDVTVLEREAPVRRQHPGGVAITSRRAKSAFGHSLRADAQDAVVHEERVQRSEYRGIAVWARIDVVLEFSVAEVGAPAVRVVRLPSP
jgi:TRAP-type uncharacterized transport system substrate-binding protein